MTEQEQQEQILQRALKVQKELKSTLSFDDIKATIDPRILQKYHLDTDYKLACYIRANPDIYTNVNMKEIDNIIDNVVPQSGTYLLMNKDKEIAIIEGIVQYGEEVYNIKQIYNTMPYHSDNITKWLQTRKAATHRSHLHEYMKRAGCDTTSGLINVTHCTTLIDTFWVKPINSSLEWKDVSLYTNNFNEVVAKIAFDGIGLYGEQFSSLSPEIGTDGMFEKCWLRTSLNAKDIVLLKRGTNEGLEPYSEALYSQLASCFSTDYVNYSLVNYHGALASKCKIFTSPSLSYVNAYYYSPYVPAMSSYIHVFEKLGFKEDIENILVLDALTLNTDRHAGNFGFLVDSDTMKVVKAAPNFDYNLSCLPYYNFSDDLGEYIGSLEPKIGGTFIGIARELLTPRLRKILITLKDFKFKDPGFGFKTERLDLLDKVLQSQIDLILK